MAADPLLDQMRLAIDRELHECIDQIVDQTPAEYTSMLRYQLGWGDEKGTIAQGKRIRPLLTLLACKACGGEWTNALPAAAAVELVHNFSLIHDDIQDDSETRRGRPTVWVKWGRAQAINAGDAMVFAAHLSLLRLARNFDSARVVKCATLLQEACLRLTHGQYLDMAFENQADLPLDLYWQMVEGKTSSLLSACLGLGALAAGAEEDQVDRLMQFGSKIGAAFQVQDDWLGIWGNDALTGKSTTSDLVSRKKTYPVLLGIHHKGRFFEEWNSSTGISQEMALELAKIMENEGHKSATESTFQKLYNEGISLLDSLKLDQEASAPLRKAVEGLFSRLS